jgi:hypothetical protein
MVASLTVASPSRIVSWGSVSIGNRGVSWRNQPITLVTKCLSKQESHNAEERTKQTSPYCSWSPKKIFLWTLSYRKLLKWHPERRAVVLLKQRVPGDTDYMLTSEAFYHHQLIFQASVGAKGRLYVALVACSRIKV